MSAMRPALPLLALLLACDPQPAATPAPPKPVVAEAPKPQGPPAVQGEPNVILIIVDSLRWDATGLSGSKAGLTPNIDKFGAGATVFTQATAAAPWTVPATLSIFTGRFPSSHGMVNKLAQGTGDPADGATVEASLSPDVPTWPESLIAKGYTAAAFTGGAGVSGRFGYNRGYSVYLDDSKFAGMDYSLPPALAWLDQNKDSRFFLFVHGYDVHGQHPLVDQTPRAAVPDYQGALDGGIEEQAKLREMGLAAIVNPGDPARLEGLSPEDIRFLKAVYDAKVKEADARVGKLLDHLATTGLLDKSVVIVAADHGEEFMEHGYIDHGATVCEHQTHVPLIIRFPGDPTPRTITTPVRTLDIFPTAFDYLGVKGPEGAQGKSLLPLLRGEGGDYPIFSESDYRLFVHLRAYRKGDQKFVLDLEDSEKRLYNLKSDPGETADTSAAEARAAYEMEQALRTWMGEQKTDPATYLGVREQHIKIF